MDLLFRKAFDPILDFLLPEQCLCCGCGRERKLDVDGLCNKCRACIVPWTPHRVPSPLDGLFVGVQYTAPIRFAVLRLKFGRRRETVSFLTQYLRFPPDWDADALVPVPMPPMRQFRRGFNQSELLAKQLSARTGIPCRTALLRRSQNDLQQKRLTGNARRKNLQNAFLADPACKGLRIVIVDDLYTTGTTVTECAKALKKAGASPVYACVVAASRR